MPTCPYCGSNAVDICPDCGTVLQEAGAAVAVAGDSGVSSQAPPHGPSPSKGGADSMESARAISISHPAPVGPTPVGEPPAPASEPPAPASEPPAPASVTLKRNGVLTASRFPIGERVVLGRFDPEGGPVDVDLGQLPEAEYVTRLHAEIWRDDSGNWFIKDLGSRNGTFVKPVDQPRFERVTSERQIADGDEIGLGNARFSFRIE